MNAYYETIRVPINETYGVMLYVVYYEVYYEAQHGAGYSYGRAHSAVFNAYESEDTAKAVVNAIKNGQIKI